MSNTQNKRTRTVLFLTCVWCSAACPTDEERNAPPLPPAGTDPTPYPGTATTEGEGDDSDTDDFPDDVLCDFLNPVECDKSEKCVPVGTRAPLGYSVWTHSACRPVASAARQPGQTCQILEGMSDGHDNCDSNSMCYSTDVLERQGTCVALCPGGSCDTGICVVDNGGALPICLSECDPLQPTCPESHGCLPSGHSGQFACHALQSNTGTVGFPCTTKNGCGSLEVCVPSELGAQNPEDYGFPDVSGYSCARYCDTNDPDSLDCAILGLGNYSCTPAPMFGSSEVGICQRQSD